MFFKTKDLMTVGNIAGGVACVLVAMEGMKAGSPEAARPYVFWAGMMILIAYFFDAFDGVVARWLNQVNQFGAEFDNVADLIAYSVAPSFLVYLVYRKVVVLPGLEAHPGWQLAVAVLVGIVPTLFGAIRFARFNIRKLDVPGLWIGFPRPAGALFLVALVNSHIFNSTAIMPWVGVVLVGLVGYMNLSVVPFIGHHGRTWSWYLKIILNGVWMTVVIAALLGTLIPRGAGLLGHRLDPIFPPNVVFDWVLLWLAYYLFIGWTDISTETRRRVAMLTADWNE